MAQSTILAAGQTRAFSSTVTIVAGTPQTIGIFSTDDLTPRIRLRVLFRTPGDDALVGILSIKNPVASLTSPGVYLVERPDVTDEGIDVGVFKET